MSCFGGAFAGMNQFNPMSIGNVQMPQAPLGPRAASPMNHPVQMNSMGAVPAVRTLTLPSPARPQPLALLQTGHHLLGMQQVGQAFIEVFVCSIYSFHKHRPCHRCSNPQQSVEEHLLSLQYINLLCSHMKTCFYSLEKQKYF